MPSPLRAPELATFEPTTMSPPLHAVTATLKHRATAVGSLFMNTPCGSGSYYP
jgi:hypothetical protein